jgi:phage/plasmid-like protein (TIGR03299 family)
MATPALNNPQGITTVAGNDFFEGTPWEEIATPIPKGATVDEILEIAGLDWGLLHLPIYAQNIIGQIETPDGETKNEYEYIRMPKTYSLLRDTDRKVLSNYMGNRYKPIDNRRAFEVFEQFTSAGNMTIETAGTIHDGKHVWGLASIGEGFRLSSGEQIKGYFLLIQSHEYGHSLKALFTPIRFPGGHTLVRNINIGGLRGAYTMPHSRVFNEQRISEINELLDVARTDLEVFKGNAEFLSAASMTEEEGVFYLCQVHDKKLITRCKNLRVALPKTLGELQTNESANRPIRKVADIVRSYPGANFPSCHNTAWGWYNAVVHGIDHVIGHSVNTRLDAAWLGKRAGEKNKAFELALQHAAK